MPEINAKEVIAYKREDALKWTPGMPQDVDFSNKITIEKGNVMGHAVVIYRVYQNGIEMQVAIKE